MHTLRTGVLVAIEGVDGSGKTTLARSLHRLLSVSFPTVLTQEPGGTELGRELRSLLRRGAYDVCRQAECLLFAADRAQHFSQVVLPALQQRSLVISDRMCDSAVVYQSYIGSLERSMVERINGWTMSDRRPDLTLYLKVPIELALDRIKRRGQVEDALERHYLNVVEQISHAYERLFNDRGDVTVLDGAVDEALLAAHAEQVIRSWVATHALQG